MSLIVSVNPLLPSLTTNQTQKTNTKQKLMLLSYQPILCCTSVLFPSIQPTKIAKYFHITSTKNSIFILFYYFHKNSISILFYYFINISYSSLTFDQLYQT